MVKEAVLVSGGPDSAVLAHEVVARGAEVIALHLNLGEFESEADRPRAERLAGRLGIELVYIDLSDALQRLYQKPMPFVLRAAHVAMRVEPFGAGVALSMASSVAAGMEAEALYYGVHKGDTVYRDNTPRFFDALSESVSIDLGRRFAIRTPLLDREKAEVFARGAELGVDLGDTWSCTEGSEVHCGTCLACGCRQIAFRDAQLEDPTSYDALRSLDQVEGDFARLAADLAP